MKKDYSLGIQCIIGLGNPGAEYAKTRHNVGAWFVDYLAERDGVSLKSETKFRSLVGKFSIDSHPCWLLKPTTFMNESGIAVAAMMRFYKLPVASLLVVHDELDFDPGVVRLKHGGGHGGHNGLRDIVQHLGSSDFYRLRIGIGHPGHKDRVSPYVLAKPNSTDRADMMLAIDEGARALPELAAGEFQKAFHALHSD